MSKTLSCLKRTSAGQDLYKNVSHHALDTSEMIAMADHLFLRKIILDCEKLPLIQQAGTPQSLYGIQPHRSFESRHHILKFQFGLNHAQACPVQGFKCEQVFNCKLQVHCAPNDFKSNPSFVFLVYRLTTLTLQRCGPLMYTPHPHPFNPVSHSS